MQPARPEPNEPDNPRPFPGGWWLVVGLAIGPAVSNGFARFAYGLILPAMRSDLGWQFTEAGWINTANAIGYLIGALAALLLIGRLGPAMLFNGGMVVTAAALLGSGLTSDFWALSGWRIVAGIGGAPVFIAAGALASTLFRDDPKRNALAIAICLAGGGGAGMLISGAVIPVLLDQWGPSGWPYTWLLLGATSAMLIPFCVVAARRTHRNRIVPPAVSKRISLMPVLPALTGYGLFGLGYIIYMTFLVAWMQGNDAQAWMIALVWSVLSAMVIASPFLWQKALSLARGGGAMAAASLATGIAILLPVIIDGDTALLVSAALFGACFFIVPTAATSFSRKHFRQHEWGSAMAWFTLAFAIGQTIGPVAAGMLADRAGSVSAGLWLSGIIMLIGAGVSWLQKRAP